MQFVRQGDADRIGAFLWQHCLEIERRLIASYYGDDGPMGQRARRLGMTANRFHRMRERVLLRLDGYLLAG